MTFETRIPSDILARLEVLMFGNPLMMEYEYYFLESKVP